MPHSSQHRSPSFFSRLFLPLAVGLISIIAVLNLWQRLITQQRTKVEGVTKSEILFVKNKIESELESRILPLEHLARRWQVRGLPDAVDWASDTALVMSRSQDYLAVELVDPALTVLRVAPPDRYQSDLGSNSRSDARRHLTLEAAADAHGTIVSRSIDLKTDGRRGFLVCVPIFSDQEVLGYIVGVFSYTGLLDPMLNGVAQDHWLSLSDGEEKIYRRAGDSTPREEELGLETSVAVRQMTWQVRLWPRPETLAQAQSLLPQVVFVGGMMMAALLAFAVYLAETSKFRAGELAIAHEHLKKEVAERARVEEELRHALKMEAVGRLAGGIAHSFNNLLLVIRGHAHLLLNSLLPSDGLQKYPREILKAAESAASLTRQLLAFSRKQILQPKVLDFNTLVSQTTGLFPSLLGPDIELILDLDPALGRVKADPGHIEQVIINLVVNARDAMPLGGTLRIVTSNAELENTAGHPELTNRPGILLVVSDTGCGMDEATRSRIFEPFFSTKDKDKGTGLGLSMVYGTVEQSGGTITVLSAPGQGTSFRIWLPRVEEELPAATTHEPKEAFASAAPLGTETVLLAEDDQGVRNVAREFLKMSGYSVLEARDAAEAIRIAGEYVGPIHLVLTDVVMPGMKGEELVERVTNIHSNIKVLYMSAYTEDAIVSFGILAPGTNFIEKPFSPDELARKVREVLHDSSP